MINNKCLFSGSVKDFIKVAEFKINEFQQLEHNKEIENITFNKIKELNKNGTRI